MRAPTARRDFCLPPDAFKRVYASLSQGATPPTGKLVGKGGDNSVLGCSWLLQQINEDPEGYAAVCFADGTSGRSSRLWVAAGISDGGGACCWRQNGAGAHLCGFKEVELAVLSTCSAAASSTNSPGRCRMSGVVERVQFQGPTVFHSSDAGLPGRILRAQK